MGGLHDQIHIQPLLPQGLEQASRHSGPIRYVGQGHHGLPFFQFDPVHRATKLQPLAADRSGSAAGEPGARGLAPAGAHHQGHAVVAGDLHGPGVEHGGSEAGQFQHLVAAHRLHELGVGHLAGIGGEYPGHIGVDLAGVGA